MFMIWGRHLLLIFSVSNDIVFSSVQSLSCVQLLATPWIAARQASLCITNSRSLFKLTSIESVMPCSRLILCCPLLLLPPIPPSIRVFSNEPTLRMRWPKYWSFSFSDIVLISSNNQWRSEALFYFILIAFLNLPLFFFISYIMSTCSEHLTLIYSFISFFSIF